MTTRHVLRFVPPWCVRSMWTCCGRQATEQTRIVTAEELDIAVREQHGVSLWQFSRWVGDETVRASCQRINVCMVCVRAMAVLRSWQDDPVRCISQYAGFVSELRDPAHRAQMSAELMAIAQLISEHREVFDRTVLREKTIASMNGPSR